MAEHLSASDPAAAAWPSLDRAACERLLAREAARVLGSERTLDAGRPLTALGLDSLAAVELCAAIEEQTGVALPLAELLDGASVAGLAAALLAHASAAAGSGPPGGTMAGRGRGEATRCADEPGEHPPSQAQRALWFVDRLAPESAAYNLAGAARVHGELDTAALGRALAVLVEHHPGLRTTFEERGGAPVRRVHASLPVDFLAAGPVAPTELPELLETEAWRPFDLVRGPLLRMRAWSLDAGGHALLFAIHHLVVDFQSLTVLLRQLDALYLGERTGSPVRLEPAGAGYGDFVRWQEQLLAGPRGERLWEHWRERLAGQLPVLDLRADRPRTRLPAWSGVSRQLQLGAEESSRLHAWAAASGATLYAVLLAGFQALLHRYTGQGEILAGSPVDLRSAVAGLEQAVGCFVNPVVMRTDFGGAPTAAELLGRVRSVALAALEHRDFPFALLAERLQPRREATRTPLFQALLALQRTSRPVERTLAAFSIGRGGAPVAFAGLSLEPLPLVAAPAPFELALTVAEDDDGLSCRLQLDAGRFDERTAQRMLGHLAALLAGMAADPVRRVAEIELLSAAEAAQLTAWNQTAAELPRDVSASDLFAAQARRTPGALALAGSGRRWSYGELDRQVERLARRLRAAGVGPEVRVGVGAGRSLELVAALLAVWRAGGAYVPLDPAHPAERRRWMLADSQAAVLLGDARCLAELSAAAARPLLLPAEHDEPPRAADGPAGGRAASAGGGAGAARGEGDARPENLAYLIYTSGSTGRPKGVAVEHRAVVALVSWAGEVYSAAELAGVLAATSIGFDLSVFELFVPLCRGGSVILAEWALALPALPEAAEVRLLNTVPSAMAELVRAGGVPPTVLTVNLAGETLRRELVRAVAMETAVRRVVNLYGPSEATTYATWAEQDLAAVSEPTLGRPIANTRVHLLDHGLRPVPVGVPAEICLGGAGLARGYFGRPDLTGERFVPSPFSGTGGEQAGARLYRTGDLARRRPDGDLEFLGRLDHQVKIRGVRVELGEVEAALLACPEVKDAAVMARDGTAGDRFLVACLVPAVEPLDTAALDSALRRELPAAMVPVAFVVLAALPLTASGKVDRQALASLALPRRPAAAPAGPRTPLEAELAILWAEVLGVEQVGIEDDFFALGGHSLLAVRLRSRLRERLGVELPLGAVLRTPTIAGLAASLRADGMAAAPRPGPERRDRQDGVLSFAQERLWLLERLRPGTAVYHLAGAIRLTGRLATAALRRALAEVVRRHQALRTCFPEASGAAVQRVAAAAAAAAIADLPVISLQGLPDAEREAARIAAADAVRAFDLARGPLLRVRLLRCAEDRHQLLLTLHHLIADEASLAILLEDLAVSYAAFCRGLVPAVAAPPLEYADFAAWQRQQLRGETLERLLAWWTERLAGLAPLDLPADRPRPPVPGMGGAAVSTPLARGVAAGLAALAQAASATPFMAFLAVFHALLARLTGAADLAVGCPVSSRDGGRMEEVIGLFVNTLVLRADAGGDPPFRELLERLRRATLAALEHRDLPFEMLVAGLGPERSLGRNPLFDAAFVFHRPPARRRAAGLDFEPFALHTATAKFDLTLAAVADGDEILLTLEYAADLFDRRTAQRLLRQLAAVAEGVVESQDQRLSDLPLLSPAERHQLLREWGTGGAAAPFALVHHHVERRAASMPDALAVESAAGTITYGELVRRSRRLASALRARGAGAESVVAIALPRSADSIVAALAVLQAGAAYLPLDPRHPAERLAAVLGDSGALLLLAEERLAAALPRHPAGVLALDRCDGEAGAGGDAADPPGPEATRPAAPEPEGLAYVIYTSGSSGTPKGAALTHAGLANLVAWHRRTYGVGLGERAALVAGPSFDAAVWEVWPYLAAGASLHLPTAATRGSPAELWRWLDARRITLAFLPTPLAEALLALGRPPGPALRALLTGGDRLHRPPAPGSGWRLINHYGPTECTVVATCAAVPEAADGGVAPAIGRPIDGFRVQVAGRYGEALPWGVPGELQLGGRGLARGYLGQPALTAAAFVPDPLGAARGEPGARLYRTGDRVRYRADGQLEFLGRADQQVKIRGFRLELGEVETILAAHPGVGAAAVAVHDGPAGPRLVAYVVPAPAPGGGGPSVEELRAFLRVRLPDYMMPAAFVCLAAMPVTANGKVDRRALPLPAAAEGSYQPPRNPVEQVVAEIWTEALSLGARPLGVEEDFFALGGHSLAAARVVARLRERLDVELPLSTLFTQPTVAALAAEIDRARAAAGAGGEPPALAAPRLARRSPPALETAAGGDPPASFSQEQLWFIDRMQPRNPVYNLPVAVRLAGALDRGALRASLAAIAGRHAALRTSFRAVEGRPVQVVAPRLPAGLPEVDLAALARGVRQAEAERLIAAEALAPFDLAAGPLVRFTLLRLAEPSHLLLLTFHHVIADGWSLRLFFDELAALYGAAVAGGRPELPDLPVQYADFACWQRDWLRGEVLARLLAYWRQRLAGAPAALDLPFDRPRPPVQTYAGRSRRAAIDAAVVPALRAFSRGESATPFLTLLAVFATLLYRYTGERDLVVGTPAANRPRVELEPLIGFFANNMALRIDLGGAPSFRELLARLRAAALADYAHQEMPFERLVEELRPERDPSHNPIYQVVFALETSTRPDRLDLPGGLCVTPLPPAEGTAKFDLALYLEDRGDRLSGLLEVNRDLLDAATATRWLGHFQTLVAAAVEDPARRLSQLPLLGPGERHQLLVEAEVEAYRAVPIGRAIPGGEIYLLDAALAPVPLGVPGEIHAGGGAIARGDLDGPAATAERYLPHPFSRFPGARLRRTGDLARAMPRGDLVLLGRIGEAARIRGRVDREALPAAVEPSGRGARYQPPTDEAERIVVEVWQELLEVERVGLRDNFFALGGGSLLLLPVQERLRQRSGVSLTIVDLFKFPTAGALAGHLRQAQAASRPPQQPEPPATARVQQPAGRSPAGAARGRFIEARRQVRAGRPAAAADLALARDSPSEEETAD
jgi:amino acid adenylation domain-containing protein